MATLFVRKDGSGTHTTIMEALAAASNGDTIDIGPGLFEENVDVFRSGIDFVGAGSSQTEVRGVQETAVAKTATFSAGVNVLSVPGGTAGLLPGRYFTGTGIPANTRILSVAPTSITISANTTAARTNSPITMAVVDSTFRVRGSNNKIRNMKIVGVPALATRKVSDNGAIFMRNAGLGFTAADQYTVSGCEIVANGDSALMCDASGVTGGSIENNTFSGQTFVGAEPAQVHAFSSLPLSVNITGLRTIEIPSEYLVDVGVGSPILAVTGFIASATTVASISGNVLTLNKDLLSNVGTTQTVTFTNIQFNIPNVARQMVVVQPNNTAVQFLNNTVNGVTGGGISYNTAVTIDAPSSTISNNSILGQFGQGYGLRVRGANSSVQNNTTSNVAPYSSGGFLLTGAGIVQSGNSYLTLNMVETSQAASGDPIQIEMDKELLKDNPVISSDAVFSDDANWRMVTYVYKKVGSSARLFSTFKNFDEIRSMKLRTGMSSGDQFQIHRIIICKIGANRELKVLKRDQIDNAANYDFALL